MHTSQDTEKVTEKQANNKPGGWQCGHVIPLV